MGVKGVTHSVEMLPIGQKCWASLYHKIEYSGYETLSALIILAQNKIYAIPAIILNYKLNFATKKEFSRMFRAYDHISVNAYHPQTKICGARYPKSRWQRKHNKTKAISYQKGRSRSAVTHPVKKSFWHKENQLIMANTLKKRQYASNFTPNCNNIGKESKEWKSFGKHSIWRDSPKLSSSNLHWFPVFQNPQWGMFAICLKITGRKIPTI